MGKSKKKPQTSTAPKANIQELTASRNGGQIALRGYTYQFLYSCYLILSKSSPDFSFQLEGTEDIDCIYQKDNESHVTHIQLKYSVNKQDASFLFDVLKNFLEAYLLDQNRSFKLVYDFPVANGHLSKLFASELDDKSRAYWMNVISEIKQDTPSWNWTAYDFDQFLACLSFEKVEKNILTAEIEKALIHAYEIDTDNISLFANSIEILCLEKMEKRARVTKEEIDRIIQLVKIDISKGHQNPAHSWIRKLNYSNSCSDNSSGFFEGKKATEADIVNGLPIKRSLLENDIIHSIHENTVTIIKSSSGQGKTTLALRAAYILQEEYTPYRLLCCDEIGKLGDTIQFFKARIQVGEKLLILIDNLDIHFHCWNQLAQHLQSELRCHYKLLITSREIDWYNYSGDLSNIQSLNIIKPTLAENEAREIFKMFKDAGRLHPGITSWQNTWNKVSQKKLLIEYVYLLTHGEMLSDRIASQMSEIGNSPSGKAKNEILRKVCFADICSVRLSINRLLDSQSEASGSDFGELLKSLESEFLVHVDVDSRYVEGLHPIRSMHIVMRLCEFMPIDRTAISVIEIANKEDLPLLFSHLPEFDLNKDEFFVNAVEKLWNEMDLSNYIPAIQGLFSGSVMQYYFSNQAAFNDANVHGGLFIISTEMCPFIKFKEFDESVDTLDRMREIFPDNENIKYLCKLRDLISVCNLHETFVYAFCGCLYKKLIQLNFSEIHDIISYAAISEWLYNINPDFNLSVNIPLDLVWSEPEKLPLDCMSALMYVSYCGNRDKFSSFIEGNLDRVLIYLKHKTRSHKLYVDKEHKAIHVEYILRLCNIKAANEESVSRLKAICKTLPIFDKYCSDALKPTVDLLSAYPLPDDAHKEMPLRNLVIMFHQSLTSLWNKTILSNYEFDTVTEWLEYWFDVRKRICALADKCCTCIYKLLNGKALGSLAKELDCLHAEFTQFTIGEKRYPKEDRPFEEKAIMPPGLEKIKGKYFQSIQNFLNQFAKFLARDEKMENLAIINLKTARSVLTIMQNYFAEIAKDIGFQDKHLELCRMETRNLEQLIMCCEYYRAHLPDKYFNKFYVKKWYDALCQKERKIVEDGFLPLQSKYSVHFPNQIYTIDMLSYYPIIVENLDIMSGNMNEWLQGCISFVDAPFDYLVLLHTNESGEINPFALQFPKRTFINIKRAIESDDPSLLEKLLPPYPVEVTAQMLGCFSEKYDMPEKNPSDAAALPVEDLAEELWIYSKSVELLSESEDANYLAAITCDIRTNVTEMLRELKNALLKEDFDWLANYCKDTFSGKRFDDALFNNVINRFVQIIT